MEPLRFERELAAPRDVVWKAVATGDGVTRWLCPRAHVEPVVGGAYELFWNPDRPESDSTLGCRVISLSYPRLLQVTWRGSDAVADVMNGPDAPRTEVKVELSPTLDGTRLVLVHSGWGSGAGWERARAWFEAAWRSALERLPAAVAELEQE